VGPYIDRWTPIKLRNISRMINGNRMHLSSISSLIAKGLNTYANKVFMFLFWNKAVNVTKCGKSQGV
jgi:hypothetical protein